ncbi:uncharacterized protein CTHT_0014060 [Thermochaetoides thermophila DSM 1495]|uniref:Coenzyme Q-binding protein COQ10 START domain-containing protein n=1 Tax=Chaetomium thermophilum (strain DSM 1495 / CBS 144.50 / IMI 039719) TaxID=759272 RepID=G0S1L8_CHATD|nr:hypothetical protein CTHT_0014060 [Thermochaetoides thermophila DSM 1495]EGS22928.1 hypothetical protein CTHT_0014060 [Thermochaetoides thermophila DSM 1495]
MMSSTAASLDRLRPTPSYGLGGTFTITCSTRIAASPQACLSVVTNSAGYPLWNRFCRACTIDYQPPGNSSDTNPAYANHDLTLRLGTHFTFDVYLDPDEPLNNDDSAGTSSGGDIFSGITSLAKRDATSLEVSVLEEFDEEVDVEVEGGEGPGQKVRKRRKGWRIAWRTRGSWARPTWMLKSERVQEFAEVGEGETEYVTWETFYGPLAPVVKALVGVKVARGFEAWAEGLKGAVEK